MAELKRGDLVLFKGDGFVFTVLSFVLSIFEPSWRQQEWKPWHTAFVTSVMEGEVNICQALIEGVCITPLRNCSNEYRVYRWLDEEPTPGKISTFLMKHIGQKYDIMVYFWTAAFYLIRHYWGRPIPRLFDNRWSCWELDYYFCDKMGKPLAEDYDFPLINEMVKILEPYRIL